MPEIPVTLSIDYPAKTIDITCSCGKLVTLKFSRSDQYPGECSCGLKYRGYKYIPSDLGKPKINKAFHRRKKDL